MPFNADAITVFALTLARHAWGSCRTVTPVDVAKAWSSGCAYVDRIRFQRPSRNITTHHEGSTAIIDCLARGAPSPHHHRVVPLARWHQEAGSKPFEDSIKGIGRETYDPKAVFSAPLLGKLIWGDLEYRSDLGKHEPLSDIENTSSVSHFSRIISSEVTKIINVPVMSNTEMNGIAGCLYNVTIPNIDNWRRFSKAGLWKQACEITAIRSSRKRWC